MSKVDKRLNKLKIILKKLRQEELKEGQRIMVDVMSTMIMKKGKKDYSSCRRFTNKEWDFLRKINWSERYIMNTDKVNKMIKKEEKIPFGYKSIM